MNLKIRLFLCLFFVMINSYAQDKEVCKALSIFKEFRPAFSLEQEETNKYIWEAFLRMDTTALDYLISLKDNKNVYICDSIYIGFNDPRIDYQGCSPAYHKRIALSALYMICALYYNNYYFATGMVIYHPDAIYIDGYNNQIYRKTTNLPVCIVTDEIEEYLWGEIVSWRKKIIGKTMEQVRNEGLYPLNETGYYWIGQKGGSIDSDFSHSPPPPKKMKFAIEPECISIGWE